MIAPAQSRRISGVKIERRRTTVTVHAGTDPIYAVLGNGGTISRHIPGYGERKAQLDLSQFAAGCIKDKVHGLGEAGTGVGKSYAYLVPAILSKTQTIIAVPTIALQNQLIEKDLPNLSRPGIMPHRFTYALLKGRRNYVCQLKADRFIEAPGFDNPADMAVFPDVVKWYRSTLDGDIGKLPLQLPMAVQAEITADSDECLGESCPKYAVCFGEMAKARAKHADIIVTNYAMVMLHIRLSLMTGGAISLLPAVPTIILDECHQVAEKARSAFTIEFRQTRWTRLARRIRRLIKRAADNLDNGDEDEADAMVKLWDGIVREADAHVGMMFEKYAELVTSTEDAAIRLGDEVESMGDAMYALHRVNVAMLEAAPTSLQDDNRKMWDKTAESLAELIGDMANIAAPRTTLDYVRLAELDGETLLFKSVPVDVAPLLRDNLYSQYTTVSVSATITENGGSLEYYREQVGLTECREIVAGSPFNYERDTLLYVPMGTEEFNPSIARQDPDDWKEYLNRMADECVNLVNVSRGRAFLLFTSRKVMDEVYKRMMARQLMPGRLPYPLLKQGDAPMTQMVERFKAEPSVLFGLKTYWEGVDIAGDALSLIVIAAIPFTPPTDPVQAARCELAQQRYGRGAQFRKILIPEATIALKQGFGRGKRTETDRAVIAILDSRLRVANYRKGMLASLPPSPMTGNPSDVRQFFREA